MPTASSSWGSVLLPSRPTAASQRVLISVPLQWPYIFLLRVVFTQSPLLQLFQVSSTLPTCLHQVQHGIKRDDKRCCVGAQAINQQPLSRIEVHGKNLFYFFGEGEATVVLHIHFGMSGRFKTVVRGDTLPEPRETTRLVLIGDKVVGQLSAMIVQHGGLGAHADSDESEALSSHLDISHCYTEMSTMSSACSS